MGAAVLALTSLARAQEPTVSVQLVIPPAETHVIGDTIPLFFRFENRASNALAFMWEGCCRFNGKLIATRNDVVIPPTPPGQALAHMFAKAERLEPGQPKDFDTRLSDWVLLSESGDYELRGHYQGVLPFQKPQVQRGLELWRGTAETPPLKVTVLNVADYLNQREARSAKSGLKLEISGASKLSPLRPSPFKLKISNLTSVPQKLRWPDALQLWVVNTHGVRVPSAANIEGAFEELLLSAGASIEREIPFDSNRLEGEPWGDYRVFADLAAESDRPRVPSNPIPLRWELSMNEVASLLTQAAGGHRTGARNAPLKLLRVYLTEIQSALAGLRNSSSLTAEARELLRQLSIAGALKPLGPKPGLVQLESQVSATGVWSFVAPEMRTAFAGGADEPAARLREVLAIRRHLGWEVAVNLQPAPQTRLGSVFSAAAQLAPLRADFAHEPRINFSTDTNNVSFLELPATPSPANFILQFTSRGVAFARHLANSQPSAPGLIAFSELSRENFTSLPNSAALVALLADGKLPQPKILLVVEDSLAWGEVRNFIEPLRQRGLSCELVAADR